MKSTTFETLMEKYVLPGSIGVAAALLVVLVGLIGAAMFDFTYTVWVARKYGPCKERMTESGNCNHPYHTVRLLSHWELYCACPGNTQVTHNTHFPNPSEDNPSH